MNPPRVLSTRKLAPEMRERLLSAGVALVEADFIATDLLNPDIETVYDCLLFTSQNAVRSLLSHPHWEQIKRPAFCVGQNTRDMLMAAGVKILTWAPYASQLAPMISEQFPSARITFFSGNLRMDTLPDWFAQHGITYNEYTVYQTRLTPHRISEAVDGVLFFSPSGVQSYLQRNALAGKTCFCIGDTTASALKGLPVQVELAAEPTMASTVARCAQFYRNLASAE